MSLVFWILISCAILNLLLMISMICMESRRPVRIFEWMLVLTFLPIVGYMIYILFGNGLSFKTQIKINKYNKSQENYLGKLNRKLEKSKNKGHNDIKKCLQFYGSNIYENNDVDIFFCGKDKIDSLKEDLKKAQYSIFMEYYIFSNDVVGYEIMDILIEKAKVGVMVKLIYDAVGSIKTPRKFFKTLKQYGANVCEFFPPLLNIRLLNFKLNYRNHRKIVVIDNKIAYTGGINIRDDHLGKRKKTSPWRDCHLKVTGDGSLLLLNIFLNDYNFCVNKASKKMNIPQKFESKEKIPLQVLCSAPNQHFPAIRDAYMKLLLCAKKSINIITPYFIPDESLMSAIKIAKNSGVDIKIILPNKADKNLVHYASLSYCHELCKDDVKIYLFNGFIHSKVLMIDDEIVSVGTCNFDNRSFYLNFEDTAILYSKTLAQKVKEEIENDIKNSIVADKHYFEKRKIFTKFLHIFCRLFAPIL